MIITKTQFKLESWRRYPEFFVYTYRAFEQAKHSKGIIRMKINPVTLRTITAWKSREDMLAFRNSGAHLEAMKKSKSFGTIKSLTWEAENFPTWKQAISRFDASVV